MNFINNARNSGNKIEIVFTFKSLLNYFKVEKSEKSATKTKSQSSRGLGLKGKRGIIELKLTQGVTQSLIIGAVGRVDTAENHRINLSVAGKSLIGGIFCSCNSVTDSCIADCFYRSGYISNLAGGKLACGFH